MVWIVSIQGTGIREQGSEKQGARERGSEGARKQESKKARKQGPRD
jgi:hypothetical protein